jgi:hypothetical protein
MFISTRNLAVAFWTTVGILAVLWVFANENSAFCIIPGWKEKTPELNYDANMSKLKKIEVPEDGHHDDPKKDDKIEEKHDNKQDDIIKVVDQKLDDDKHDDTHVHDDYVNNIKEDPVGHNDIKENFASY